MERSPEEIKAGAVAELPPHKKLIVDVGTNQLPLPFFRDKGIQPEEVYLGIDIALHNVKDSKRTAELMCSKDEHGGSACFMQANAAHLPIADGSADELLFGNVFGDPSIYPAEKDSFVPEITRVLKEDGVCIIKETNTPTKFKETIEFFERNGFIVERSVHCGDPDWEDEIEKYQTPQALDRDSFILYIRKDPEVKNGGRKASWNGGWSNPFYDIASRFKK